MKVVILCGGLGTRLREETEFRPKPMVEIGGKPILWHIMKTFAYHGFKEFVICLGYKGKVIKDYFLNYAAMNCDFTTALDGQQRITYHERNEEDFTVTLADTGQGTMTGGRVSRIKRYIDSGNSFLLTYGDGVSDANISEFGRYHQSHGKLATIMTVRPSVRFGCVKATEQKRVFEFAEKPVIEGWCSGGLFALRYEAFDYIGGDDCIFERGPLERLAVDGELMAWQHEGFSFAMDTYCEWLKLNEMWDSGNAPWKVWE